MHQPIRGGEKYPAIQTLQKVFKLLCVYKSKAKELIRIRGPNNCFGMKHHISVIMIMAHYAYSDVLGMKKLIDDPLSFSVNISLSRLRGGTD
jgi:hypothetical protein